MPLKQTLQTKWQAFNGDQRKQAVRGGIVVVGIVIILAAFYGTGQNKKNQVVEKPKIATVSLGEGRLEDDVRAQVEKQGKLQEEANKQAQDKLGETGKSLAQQQAELDAINKALEALKTGQQPPGSAAATNPPAWPDAWGNKPPPAVGAGGGQGGVPPAPMVKELVGGIGSLNGGPDAGEAKKKANPKFFLPVGFMPAKLLTGLKAKTVETARNNPEPMLLRVQAPAVLPNEVRAALQGCFVIANGFGSLASERVEASLVSLSCVDYDGHSVIEADVKGIVVDKDGVKGLAGHVVSKAGATMARALIAGAFQGAGQALAQSSQTQSVSALGATNTIQPNQVGQAALGTGLSSAANEISKVYLDLVRQSAPVVEHGADTDCSLVLTEGVWLEVKDYEQDAN